MACTARAPIGIGDAFLSRKISMGFRYPPRPEIKRTANHMHQRIGGGTASEPNEAFRLRD